MAINVLHYWNFGNNGNLGYFVQLESWTPIKLAVRIAYNG
ncbi:hypothetical protein MFFC18_21390 [Mariniblastus fucicola]|uniref:Uncharacterized protein n=1 Tax=Mariniblastus fucicola TaxID=980251 RepID=A0A5B9PI01_9BACT|nr:hypothetical protein MFFC18_21390 [Mariniblastus fucicola]